MDKLLQDLKELAEIWDLEATARHRDGMEASADTLRTCRNELRQLIKRHGGRTK